jgi:hypothetical protein
MIALLSRDKTNKLPYLRSLKVTVTKDKDQKDTPKGYVRLTNWMILKKETYKRWLKSGRIV